MKRFTIAVVIFFVAGLSLIAQPGMFHDEIKCDKGESFKGHMMEKLNLTDEQKQKIAYLKIEVQKKTLDLKNTINKNKLDLKKLMMADDLDKSKITSIIQENTELQGKIKKLHIENWFKIYGLLDKSQKQIFKKSFAKMGMDHHKMKKGYCCREHKGKRMHRSAE